MYKENAKKRAFELVETLNYYSRQYYTYDNSKISDYEYDLLYKELVDLENEHKDLALPYSPTKRVGDVTIGTFKKVNHLVKMDSLQDIFETCEISTFLDNVKRGVGDTEFVVEQKIDGLSVTLTYENGIFTSGATRGDGFIGEDVTENLKTIKSIPLMIDTDVTFLQVRGEVYMPLQVFKKITDEQSESNQSIFKNPRNAAAGSLRQKDSKISAKRHLEIFIFNLQKMEGKSFTRHSETLDWLKKIGFKVSPQYKVLTDYKTIVKEVDNINKNRKNYDYDIDGAVIKVNNIEKRQLLGNTDKTPKWAIAFKYPPEEKTTKLLDIEINVGRTGTLTPTAIFMPISVVGSSVARAVLHNQDFINDKKIAVGDIVSVRKAGDIIPEVVRVVEHKNENGVFKIPSQCPSCGEDTVQINGSSAIKCVNKYCPEKNYRIIVHFASRDCMNIDGLGARIIKILIDNNLITKIEDLYKLGYDDIIGLEGFKEKSTNNLLTSIMESKGRSFNNVLFSLGIGNIGKKAARLLVQKFEDIDTLLKADIEDIKQIDGFGEIMAISIVTALKDESLLETIKYLSENGLTFKSENKISDVDKNNFFYENNFVVTGTLKHYKRNKIEEIINNHGGILNSGISKKTDYLICGENAGSKLKKASDLGIKVINEKEFIDIIK